MKKLEKLKLKKLKNEVNVLEFIEAKSIFGGGIDDNDCLIEAISYFGYSENDVWAKYTELYGAAATLSAIENGIPTGNADALVNSFLSTANVSNENSLNNELNLGRNVIVTICAGSGGSTHAIIALSSDGNGSYTCYDPDSGQTYSVESGDIDFSYAASVGSCN